VIDRSGSMSCQIKQLQDAMNIFMRSLPADCYFNIVGFGSGYTKLSPQSMRYTDESLKRATDHIATIMANYGGTNIYEPLSDVLSQPLIPFYSRQVFLLTDGQVSNTDDVIRLVQRKNQQCRVFSLGIGSSVSHFLVNGIARAGNGTSAFVASGERVERKVLKQLNDGFLPPSISPITTKWPYTSCSHD